MEPYPGWPVVHSLVGITNKPMEMPLYGMPVEFTRSGADRLIICDRQKSPGKAVRLQTTQNHKVAAGIGREVKFHRLLSY